MQNIMIKMSSSYMQFISEQTVNEMKLGMTTKLPVDGEDVCDAILFQFK